MSNPIVILSVSQQVAPLPSTLQKTGALLSQGGTITAPGTRSLLTAKADLTTLLAAPKALTSLTWSGNVVTGTTTAPHGWPQGHVLRLSISGELPVGYNGSFDCMITGASTFTYALAANPGAQATAGTVTTESAVELSQMATTFFAQGSQQGVYVLEAGAGSVADGVAFLDEWIGQNPGVFYSYLVPRYWDAYAGFINFLGQFNNTTAKTYFFVTTTLQNWTVYADTLKCVRLMIEAPDYAAWPANALTAISFSGSWALNALTAISWSPDDGGTVTATTTTAHGVAPGQFFTITGCTPAGYNGTFVAEPGTTGDTLVYALATDPGAESVLGDLAASVAGTATATTTTNHGISVGQFFSLAGTIPVGYNGTFEALDGTTGDTIVFALPSNPGAETTLGTLVASQYASAGIPDTEFSHASDFRVTLNYKPASTNKVTPLNFAFLFDVTPFPLDGNASLLSQLSTGNVAVVGTGAQGGISENILIGGNNLDGNPFNYWYSVDWAQINLQRNVTAALINGANNPVNPLYYDQNGINQLQQVSVGTMNTGISNGLVLFPVKPTALDAADFVSALDADAFIGFTVVNAEPFIAYATENPNDYAIGAYNGLTVEYVPLRGFDSITINVVVSNFVTAG